MTPTTEQTDILIAATATGSNLLINALAGCGKTTTLEMIERAVATKPILYLVFNRKNAADAEKRMLSTTSVRTLNSLGHRIWAKTVGRNLTVRPKKCGDILRSFIADAPRETRSALWSAYSSILDGVEMAKALGYLPAGGQWPAKSLCTKADLHAALDETPDELTAAVIDKVLSSSVRLAYDGQIDYNDQVYMPAVFGGVFPQFPLVLVDEAQDLSPVNHMLLRRLHRPSSRIVAVGDRFQSIYGFRGALEGGMDSLSSTYSMTPLDLSVSFRCPRAIVEAARWRVPKFQWIKEGGHVETLNSLDLDRVPDCAAFLCRNNAPLFRLAMRLLSAGRSVSVAGSDIGPKLVKILGKLGPSELPRGPVLVAIDAWEEKREEKGSKTAGDIAECMRVFAAHGANLGQAMAYAEHLFKQEGSIRLSTGHKAKGLEWPVVYHLDPWLIGEDDQELNLRYVIQTRSLDQYYEIDSACIQH